MSWKHLFVDLPQANKQMRYWLKEVRHILQRLSDQTTSEYLVHEANTKNTAYHFYLMAA